MSMQEYPNSGYTVNAKEIVNIVPDELKRDYNRILEESLNNYDTESMVNWINSFWPKNLPIPEVFIPGDEDTVDNEYMFQGEMYFIFDDNDLFIKTPTEFMKAIQDKVNITKSHWSVWG